MDQLSSIRQGKKDADAFTVEFDTLVSLAGYTDDAAILNIYQRALNSPLVDSIFRGDLPLGYEAWKKRACVLDQQFRQRQEQKKHFSAHAPKLSQKAPRDPNAMDVDQTSTTPTRPKFTKLTDAQRAALIANKGCFRCRIPAAGHTARDCPVGKRTTRIRTNETEPSTDRRSPPPPPSQTATSSRRTYSPPQSTTFSDITSQYEPSEPPAYSPEQRIQATRAQIRHLVAALPPAHRLAAINDWSDEEGVTPDPTRSSF
jgi:hypothetical protein